MTDPWYVKSFKEDYLQIYAHRTDEAAAEEVQHMLDLIKPAPGSKILDLCCGNGRHSRQFASRGYVVTGVDLSEVLLAEAIKRNDPPNEVRYVQSDVRSIPFRNEFDIVVNLFTSFGYFDDRAENMKVFSSINKALKAGGQFLIDFLNPGKIRKDLVPYSERQSGHLHIQETRKIEGNTVIKQIVVEDEHGRREYQEKVQLFEIDEMQDMLEESGLTVTAVYGNFAGLQYSPDDSPRMLIHGYK